MTQVLGKKSTIQKVLSVGAKVYGVVKKLIGHKKSYDSKAESPRSMSNKPFEIIAPLGEAIAKPFLSKSQRREEKSLQREEKRSAIPSANIVRSVGQGILAGKGLKGVVKSIYDDETRSPQDKITAVKRETMKVKTQAKAPSMKQMRKLAKRERKKQQALLPKRKSVM